MLLYLTSNQKSNLIDPAVRNMTLPAKKLVGRFSLKSFVTKDMRNYANAKFFVVDAACIEESGNDFTLALQSFQMMFSARIIVILSGYEDVNGEVQRLLSIGVVNLVKLLRYAQELMNDPKLSWRESVKTFLKNCCYGEKVGFAVLSIEEEQQVYRCLSNENFHAFRNDQLYLYRNLLTIFGVPMDNIDPRLFGNLSLTMMMSYKAIPDTMPFLFPEVADDMVEFQINALLDEMQRAKKEAIR